MANLSPKEIKQIKGVIDEGFDMLQKTLDRILKQNCFMMQSHFAQTKNHFEQNLVAIENNFNRNLDQYQKNFKDSFDRIEKQKSQHVRPRLVLHEERRLDGSVVPWFQQ